MLVSLLPRRPSTGEVSYLCREDIHTTRAGRRVHCEHDGQDALSRVEGEPDHVGQF
jgi:hypothetical protein